MKTQVKLEDDADTLEKLISNYGPSKYTDIVWAMQWAGHMRRQEEFRQLPMAALIERAMLDAISGKVTREEIEEACRRDQEIDDNLSTKREDPAAKKPKKESAKKEEK